MDYKLMDLSSSEKKYFYCIAFFLGIVIGWLFFESLLMGVLAGSILCTKTDLLKEYLSIKKKQKLLTQFKDFLYSLSSSALTGRSIGQGIADSIDFWKDTYEDDAFIMIELRAMNDKLKKGNMQDIAVLEDFANRTGLRDVYDVALVCSICKRMGGNLSEALGKCNEIIGDKISLEKELETAMMQKKAEGRIIASAPFVMLMMMKIASPQYISPLTETNGGRFISLLALILIGFAWTTIERVNSIEI